MLEYLTKITAKDQIGEETAKITLLVIIMAAKIILLEISMD